MLKSILIAHTKFCKMEDIDFMENPSNLTEDASDSTFLIVAIAAENEDLLKT